MSPYEYNILNTKVLNAARQTDPATYASISLLAKDTREYLLSKKINVTKEEALILLITTLAYNRGEPNLAVIVKRHIISCKAFYEELNRKAEEESEEPEQEELLEPELATDPAAEAVTEKGGKQNYDS